ncbi:MAG: DUF1453 family protein [Hyphomonadaceae bacterium]
MNQTVGYYIALPIILMVLALRIWRGSRVRRLRIERLWIIPLIFLGIIGLALSALPPPSSATGYAVIVASLAAGAAAGWVRGRMVRVRINVETHELESQNSPLGMIVFLGLLAARMGLRYLIGSHEAEWHVPAAAVTDGFLLFYGGMIVGMRVEIWLRARKLLAEAVAARRAGQAVPDEISQDHA